MKLARVIRFDRSDLNVFPVAADEGEWALVVTVFFAGTPQEKLVGKVKQAFSNGFLGMASFGFSTLVSVASARPQDKDDIAAMLTDRFVAEFGAPDRDAAMAAAMDEINFMAELCADHKTGTLLALQRRWTDDGIKETFRSLPKPDSCAEQKIWTVVDDG